MRTQLIVIAAGCLACALGVGAASAQTVPIAQPPIAEPEPSDSPADQVDHVQGPRGLRPAGPQQAKMVLRPGGYLLRTFDTNHDGVISKEELAAGAARAFEEADENHDGVVGAIEQTAWAANYGGIHDVLSNTMLFDVNLDHSVSRDEFVYGVMRLAEPVKDASGGVQVSKLMIAEKQELPPLPEGKQVIHERRGGFR